MIRPSHLAAIVAVLTALSLSACGAENDSATTTAETPPTVRRQADSICREFVAEVEQIGKGALANPTMVTSLSFTTERLVKPSIPVLERVAGRMQALAPKADDPLFTLYASLFDPAIVLAQQRLAAGRAEDLAKAKQLEDSLTSIGQEQQRAARLIGLPDCEADFSTVLLSSLTQ